MKKIFEIVVIVFLLIYGKSVFAQENKLILTCSQNTEWFDELKKLNQDEKLAFIKKRMIQDTSIFNTTQRFSEVMIVENGSIANELKKTGNLSEGRVLYFVRFNKNPHKKCNFEFFVWYNGTNKEKINQFCTYLTPERIKDIELISDGCPEIGMYGARGKFGVVIFDIKSRKDYKDFKKINED
jgi:hypothetical protein